MTKQQTASVSETWTTGYKAMGILACIGGLILHLVIGSMHQWGIITIYVTSYFRMFDKSVTLQSNAITFPLIQFCYGLTMRLGIYLAEVTHPLLILISASFCFSACIFGSSYVTSIGAFLVLYSILWGLFVGLVFMIPVVECNKYFPGMKMYVNGCVFAGTGLSSVVFSTFSYSYINPSKVKPVGGYYLGTPQLQTIAMTVPSLLRYLSLFFILMSLGAIAMMAPVILSNRKKENQKRAIEKAKKEENQRNGIIVPEEGSQIIPNEANTIKQSMTSSVCWVIVITILMSGPGLYLMNGNYKTYVKNTINDDEFLTLIGVLAGIANGVSRFFWNILFMKTGYRFVMSIILGMAITVYATIRFTVENEIAYLFEIFFINLCLGGLLVVTPTVIQIIFGPRTGSNIYGFFWCTIATSNWIHYFYVGYVSKQIGFNNILYICLAMATVPFVFLIFYHYEGPWKNSTKDLGWFRNVQKKEDEEKKEDDKKKDKNINEQTLNEINTEKGKDQEVQKKGRPKKLPPLNDGYEIVLRSTTSIPEDNTGAKKPLASTQKTIQANSSELIESKLLK